MRLTALLLTFAGLAACTSYTDKTSPCFGKDGKPVVSRGMVTPLSFSATSPEPTANCQFEPVMRQ